MQIGDTVTFAPAVWYEDIRERRSKSPRPETVTGTVVWIHPKRRYYIVEYEVRGYKLQQALYFKK